MEPDDAWQLTERVRAGARSAKGDPFAAAVRATRMAMIVTDPRRLDNPIVFANDAFLHLTGYTRLEVTGRNCRFLQGPETDFGTVARVREAIRAERTVQAELLNYRKDGSTFHNALFISPVHDEGGKLLFFFASQLDVSDRYALQAERDRTRAALEANALLLREIGHRTRNDLQMIAAMLALQSSGSAEPPVRDALSIAIGRVEALMALYRTPADEGASHDLSDLARTVAGALVEASGRQDIAVDFDLAPVAIRGEAAGPLAIILNEVVTNALKHAFAGRSGRLSLRVVRDGDAVLVEVGDDGLGASAAPPSADAFGTGLIAALTRQLGGTHDRRAGAVSGTVLTFNFPWERLGA